MGNNQWDKPKFMAVHLFTSLIYLIWRIGLRIWIYVPSFYVQITSAMLLFIPPTLTRELIGRLCHVFTNQNQSQFLVYGKDNICSKSRPLCGKVEMSEKNYFLGGIDRRNLLSVLLLWDLWTSVTHNHKNHWTTIKAMHHCWCHDGHQLIILMG